MSSSCVWDDGGVKRPDSGSESSSSRSAVALVFNFAGDRFCLAAFTLQFGCNRLSRVGSSSSRFIDDGVTFSIESSKTSQKPELKPKNKHKTSVGNQAFRITAATPKVGHDRTEPRQTRFNFPVPSHAFTFNTRVTFRIQDPRLTTNTHLSSSSRQPTSMANRTCGGGGGWSFSLRSNNYHYDTSGSDDADDDDDDQCPIPSTTTARKKTQPSEEARLLGELDLASRTDAANYKPNPWTIAKANAAVRAPRLSAPTKEARQKKHNSAQPTVLDLLRGQSKANPVAHTHHTQSAATDPVVPVREAASSKSLNPDRLLDDDAHIPSDDTLVDNVSDARVFSKLGDDDPTLAPCPSLLGTPPDKAEIHLQARQSHPAFPRTSCLLGPHRLQDRIPAEVPPPSSNKLSAGRELRAILFHSALPTGPTQKGSSISQPSHLIAPSPRIAPHSLFSGKWYLPSLLVQLASLCHYS